jgi:hypothetical protein
MQAPAMKNNFRFEAPAASGRNEITPLKFGDIAFIEVQNHAVTDEPA